MFTMHRIAEKRRNSTVTNVVFACAWALVSLEPGAFAQAGPAGSQAAPIEGTWIFSIHRVTQSFTFSALQSFTAGGVSLATGTVDRTPPPPISPLYGSWRWAGGNSYAASICFFVFDLSGNALVMIKTNETFQLTDQNNLTGSGTGFVCDLNGDNCVNANLPVTIIGKRLVAEGASD